MDLGANPMLATSCRLEGEGKGKGLHSFKEKVRSENISAFDLAKRIVAASAARISDWVQNYTLGKIRRTA